MNISRPFIERPVATTLLTIAVALSGVVAYNELPVSPLPQVDFPTISVNASLPGASPETMASAVATPLERQFGRIAAVTEMTSSSSLGGCSITLQFELNRDINAAARDVQAGIAAARGYLPANLPSNPNYRKVNPADTPIFQIALTSSVLDKGEMYDAASTIMAQKLSQIKGVGQVFTYGSALPGVRVELNPMTLNKYGIGLESVRSVLSSANANIPKGHFSDGKRVWEIGSSDQIFKAKDYRPLIVAYRNGSAVRVSDVGEAVDSVEDLRNAGYSNGKPSVLVTVNRQPGANIIDTVDQIRAALPALKAAVPHAIDFTVTQDQTVTIRASVRDVEITLLISVVLVILVVFVFLRYLRRDVSVRLQSGQSVTDGADDFHGLRGGRRDRGDRKHHALSRGRNETFRCRAAGGRRDRFHRADDQHFLGGGLYSPVVDGRNRRASVPRVFGCFVGGDRRVHAGLAHNHSHDVRLHAEGARRPRLDVPDQRTRL
jgi:multidrug efflux pump